MKKVIKIVVMLAVLAGLGWGGYWVYGKYIAKAPVGFRTAPVQRGEVLQVINATGVVEPEEAVDVGAQVAGEIVSFGKDVDGKKVDFVSRVSETTTLAQIDPTLYQADVDTAKAMLAQAVANVGKAKADRDVLKAKLFQAERDWTRAQKLGPSDALAQSSYDSYESAYLSASASVTEGETVIKLSEAAKAAAQTSLERAQRNLGYCTIVSPVKGVVISRRVNVGQTVVSSLNAPSLFLIAKDLKHVQVWVSVNEADIESIYPGQPVAFTCDGAPDVTFTGTVDKIRLDATMSQNVVTYTVVVTADNSAEKLKPYLTANVNFEVARHKDVLKVPNAALRWVPRPEMVAEEYANQTETGLRRGSATEAESGVAPAESGSAAKAARSDKTAGQGKKKGGGTGRGSGHGTVWVKEGLFVKPIRVKVGLTDGLVTEVSSPDLQEDMAVVIDTQRQASGNTNGTTNPFVQPRFGR